LRLLLLGGFENPKINAIIPISAKIMLISGVFELARYLESKLLPKLLLLEASPRMRHFKPK